MASSMNEQSSISRPIDRRMRGGRRRERTDQRIERSRRQWEPGRKRMAFIVGAVIFFIVGGLAAYGFYDEFVAPPRVVAAKVGDTTYTQGDLVDRLRMLQARSPDGAPLDYAKAPFEVSIQMAEAGIIRRLAPGYGVEVTDAEVDAALRVGFSSGPLEGEQVSQAQLDREFNERYQAFLNVTGLSDGAHREIVEEGIYRSKLRERLAQIQVPAIEEHVEISWLKLSSAINEGEGDFQLPTADDVKKRLETEAFEDIAGEYPWGRGFADEKGYVGWVPRGAFLSLDPYFFGSKDQEALPHNQLSEPIYVEDGIYFINVTGGPKDLEVSDLMKERLKDQSMRNWLAEEWKKGADEGWLEVNADSELYFWAIDQVKQILPAITAPEDSQG